MDTWLLVALRGLAGHGPLPDGVIVFAANWLIVAAVAAFAGVAWATWRRAGARALRPYAITGLAGIVALVIATGLKVMTRRPRPFIALPIHPLFTDTSFSFPSGHTTLLFALAAAAAFHSKRLAVLLAICGLLVGLARIAAGVHYPSDIAGGALLGIAVGVLTRRVFEMLLTRPSRVPAKT